MSLPPLSSPNSVSRSGPGFTTAIVITVSLFFLWGMANNLNDILIAQFKKAFTLSDFETSFVQQAFYLGYFLFAIPASLLMNARGYKAAIVTGLTLYGAGALLFFPAAATSRYELFLLALFIIAAGLAFLETSANPLMTELGDPAGATRRLNWAQAANPLGSIAGILVGRTFILSGVQHDEASLAGMTTAQKQAWYAAEVHAVLTPYLVIAVVVLTFALAALLTRFPVGEGGREGASLRGLGAVIRKPRLIFATVAQFFYVGAQVGLWSYTIRYAQANVPGIGERGGADALFVSLILFSLGRFVGAALMIRLKPVKILAGFALVSMVLTLGAVMVGGRVGLYMMVATSFFMSIQYPTIFALGVEGLGPLRRTGASLIVMAIIGGALLTGAMGFVSDRASISSAVAVPGCCFLVVLAFAVWAGRRPGSEA